MNLKQQIGSVLIGLGTVAALGFGFYWLVAALIDKLNSIDSDVSKALISAVVAIVGATLTIVVGKLLEQRIKIKQDVRLKKVPVYEEQMKVIFDVLFASKRGKKAMNEAQLVKAFSNFTEKLIIWGDSAVIKAWEEFRTHKWEDGNNQVARAGFVKFEAFVKALRKDLGNDNKNLKDGDLLRLFINDFEKLTNSEINKP